MKRSDTILVTGANGLAGSAIVEYLNAEGFSRVMGATRDDVDLRNHDAVNHKFRVWKPKYVFHAAATVFGLGGNMANQALSLLDNTLINTAVIDAASKCGSVKKITVMGTNAAYPWPTSIPFREDNIYLGRPDAGEFGYGHAKRHMLAMLEAYHQSYGLEYAYLISGNLYGPRDRFNIETGHVLPSLIKKFHTAKSTGSNVEVWGDGTAKRDFLYVRDLARIVQMFMSEDIKSGAVNIGSGETTSIRQLADMLCVISGVKPSRVFFDTSKPTGRPDCYADLARLRGLGFIPAHSIATGLQETWDWFVEDRAHRDFLRADFAG